MLQLSCDLQTLNLALIYCHINLNFVHINILCLSQVIFQDFLLKDQFPVPVGHFTNARQTTCDHNHDDINDAAGWRSANASPEHCAPPTKAMTCSSVPYR